MSTVVQKVYSPQIAPGVPGLVADESSAQVTTYLCGTDAGIPFGVAVSQGPSDRSAVLGGTKFVGVSVRDITLIPGVPLDPLADVGVGADLYPKSANMGVLTRGDIWVVAGTDVVGGDPLYYDTTTGELGNSASGMAAYGSVVFSSQPNPGDTITLNGTVVGFQNPGGGGTPLSVPRQRKINEPVTKSVRREELMERTGRGEELHAEQEHAHDVHGAVSDPQHPTDELGQRTRSGAGHEGQGQEEEHSGQPQDPGENQEERLERDQQARQEQQDQQQQGREQSEEGEQRGPATRFGTAPTGYVNIGLTLGQTLTNLAAALNASVDAGVSALRYATYPATPGGVGEGSGANTLSYADKTVGTAGNALVVSTTVPGATVSGVGGALAGGTAAATAVPYGYWKRSAIAGQLSVVSLAIQR